MTIGSRIKAAREAAGLTLRQMADKIGIPASMLCRIETGNAGDPRLSTLNKLAAFSMSLGQLLGIENGTGEPQARDDSSCNKCSHCGVCKFCHRLEDIAEDMWHSPATDVDSEDEFAEALYATAARYCKSYTEVQG